MHPTRFRSDVDRSVQLRYGRKSWEKVFKGAKTFWGPALHIGRPCMGRPPPAGGSTRLLRWVCKTDDQAPKCRKASSYRPVVTGIEGSPFAPIEGFCRPLRTTSAICRAARLLLHEWQGCSLQQAWLSVSRMLLLFLELQRPDHARPCEVQAIVPRTRAVDTSAHGSLSEGLGPGTRWDLIACHRDVERSRQRRHSGAVDTGSQAALFIACALASAEHVYAGGVRSLDHGIITNFAASWRNEKCIQSRA